MLRTRLVFFSGCVLNEVGCVLRGLIIHAFKLQMPSLLGHWRAIPNTNTHTKLAYHLHHRLIYHKLLFYQIVLHTISHNYPYFHLIWVSSCAHSRKQIPWKFIAKLRSQPCNLLLSINYN